MELIIIALSGSYVALIAYVLERFRRYFKLPVDERRSMTFAQRMLTLYGFYKVPKKDIQSTASSALINFQESWNNMQGVFKQFEGAFEQRKQELQEAEENLAKLEQEIQERNERLRAQKELTPDAAREVELFVERSSKYTLRQQVIVSTVFFVLGCAVTLTITLLVT